MTHSIVKGSLSGAVADDGTFTVNYPSGKDKGDFYGAHGHKIDIAGNDTYSWPADFNLTFGTANITVTNKSEGAWADGANFVLQIEEQGDRQHRTEVGRNDPISRELVASTIKGAIVLINLGAPDVLDVDGICVAQAVAAPGNMLINGALATGGVATMDKPRAVEIDSSGVGDTTQTATITGTDVYGKTMTEDIAFNGTTAVAGVKAFKTVTQVAVDIALAGNGNVGTTDVLGLPVYLPDVAFVLQEIEDGAVATAGTLVAGVNTVDGETATSGDVRGTYVPNGAANGAKVNQLLVMLPDPGFVGETQA